MDLIDSVLNGRMKKIDIYKLIFVHEIVEDYYLIRRGNLLAKLMKVYIFGGFEVDVIEHQVKACCYPIGINVL